MPLNVSRVAIIGAGPSGLAAAKYLLAEKHFSHIRLFEQRATPGGVWNYTPRAREDGFAVPRTRPSDLPDQVLRPEVDGTGEATAKEGKGEKVEFMSPIYDLLETNIPHSLMCFSDTPFPEGSSLFPRHVDVLQYLVEYARDLEPYISYQSQVLSVDKPSSSSSPWKVKVLNLETDETTTADFDAVVVASGHYNDPFIPNIAGLVEFDRAHPGAVSHSKFYRRPDDYKDKKVIVVGNSASGVDVSAQLSTLARLPVLVSEREKPSPLQTPSSTTPWATLVPEIVEFIPSTRSARFADGRVESDVDSVIFCTGFHYSYPFLSSLQPPVVVPKGSHADHLWEHVLYAPDPTLAFLSVPQRIVPFPVSEAQSAVLGRIWSGRLEAPSTAEMNSWVDEQHRIKGAGKAIHIMGFPEDVDYVNRLSDLSGTATKAPVEKGLENGGEGKTPPYWDNETRWVRRRVPEIKLASRAVGDKRHELRTLKDLGFDYAEWKKTAKDGEE